MSDAVPVIAAEALEKRFGSTRALDGFSVTVTPGEVHGFLGPNGAGKSTTIRALLGQLRLDAGEARIFGHDCWREALTVHRRIAYVPGDVALWNSLSGGECIDLLIRLQGGGDSRRRDELVKRFDLDTTKRTRTYSKGNRQKVALVAALSKGADLLLLDEPTSGLDPLMEEAFQETIREEHAAGRTVLLSSHILSEVETLCDRVTIIRQGRTVSTGTLDDLRGRTHSWVTATTEREIPDLERLAGVSAVTRERRDRMHHVHFQIGGDGLGEALHRLMDAGLGSLTVEPPSLNELFLAAYRDEAEVAETKTEQDEVPA